MRPESDHRSTRANGVPCPEGGIFWCYGLLTFARFLGAFADLGWAWNDPPASAASYPSAEFVESAVVFTYGITNTVRLPLPPNIYAHPG